MIKDIPIKDFVKKLPDIDKNLEKFARAANIMPKFILNSLEPYITDIEAKYYINFDKHMRDKPGILYSGKTVDVYNKFSAIAGFLVRNYTNARIMMSSQLGMRGEDTRCLDCSVLLVPDFHLTLRESEAVPAWKVSDLLGVLYHRASHSRPTILYVQDFTLFSTAYGKLFTEHLETYSRFQT